jgi:sporulation protein YlmC with PRC-barrel domain
MNKKRILTLGAIAALTAWAPKMSAADAEVNVQTDNDHPKIEAQTQLDKSKDNDITTRSENDTTNTRTDRVMHANKASGLLGMEVRNKQNEKLGEIKDVVLDLPSGKVSYAVLAVGGFLGLGEKLIALPPSALHTSEDGQTLTINADKAKIQAAPGFAATSWPSVHNPEMNFWNEATGAPAAGESASGSLRKEKQIDVDVDTDKDHKGKIYTDADKDKKVDIDIEKK